MVVKQALGADGLGHGRGPGDERRTGSDGRRTAPLGGQGGPPTGPREQGRGGAGREPGRGPGGSGPGWSQISRLAAQQEQVGRAEAGRRRRTSIRTWRRSDAVGDLRRPRTWPSRPAEGRSRPDSGPGRSRPAGGGSRAAEHDRRDAGSRGRTPRAMAAEEGSRPGWLTCAQPSRKRPPTTRCRVGPAGEGSVAQAGRGLGRDAGLGSCRWPGVLTLRPPAASRSRAPLH